MTTQHTPPYPTQDELDCMDAEQIAAIDKHFLASIPAAPKYVWRDNDWHPVKARAALAKVDGK